MSIKHRLSEKILQRIGLSVGLRSAGVMPNWLLFQVSEPGAGRNTAVLVANLDSWLLFTPSTDMPTPINTTRPVVFDDRKCLTHTLPPGIKDACRAWTTRTEHGIHFFNKVFFLTRLFTCSCLVM